MGKPGTKLHRQEQAIAASSGIISPSFSSRGLIHSNATSLESAYSERVPLDHRRRFGQFFTPPSIAELMCEWVVSIKPASLLDPAVGLGIFVRKFLEHKIECEITAIDIDSVALNSFSDSNMHGHVTEAIQQDFLTWESPAKFDAILANPPYLRHHDLNYDRDIFREIGCRNDIRLSRLTNAYALFILEICRRLNLGGRAAVVVPGEWLNANFGVPIKEFLLRDGFLKKLVYFSHAELVFDDALTTACLLFLERSHEPADEMVHTLFVKSGVELAHLRQILSGGNPTHDSVFEQRFTADDLLKHPKWNSVLENGQSKTLDGFVPLRELASTCRGIATGANKFFHVSQQYFQEQGISQKHALPCVGRANSVNGLIFSQDDLDQLAEEDRPTYLISFDDDLSDAEKRYVLKGESEGLHRRYLTSARSPWYRMEQRDPAPIWAAVFGRKELRFIWNQAGVANLTTFHCVYPHDKRPVFVQALLGCLNSRIVQKRSRSHQRVYGGGLLKYEPKDLLEIPLPDLRLVSESTTRELAEHFLALNQTILEKSQHLPQILEKLDQLVLSAAAQANEHS